MLLEDVGGGVFRRPEVCGVISIGLIWTATCWLPSPADEPCCPSRDEDTAGVSGGVFIDEIVGEALGDGAPELLPSLG